MPTDSSKGASVRTIKASEFKARCLKLMDEVAESGEEIVITKHGRPVSRLAPYRGQAEVAFRSPPGQDPDPWRHRISHAGGVV